MIRKEFIIIAAILIVAFAGVTICKYSGTTGSGNGISAAKASNTSQLFWTHYNLATKYRLGGEADSAITAYQKALNLNPVHKDALYYIGNMYMKVDEFDKAQKAWKKLTGINPQSERAYNQLGNLYFCIQHKKYFRPEKSKWYFMRANELNKEALNPKIRLGEIALFQDRMDDAQGIFTKLLMTQHKNAEIYFLLGYISWDKHKNQNAVIDLEHTFEYVRDLHVMTDENGGKAISAQNKASDKRKGCDLYNQWISQNLSAFRKFDVRVAMPEVYKAFNQYIITTRGKVMNHM